MSGKRTLAKSHVCFTPESGRVLRKLWGLLRAKSGHRTVSITSSANCPQGGQAQIDRPTSADGVDHWALGTCGRPYNSQERSLCLRRVLVLRRERRRPRYSHLRSVLLVSFVRLRSWLMERRRTAPVLWNREPPLTTHPRSQVGTPGMAWVRNGYKQRHRLN
jgi:hypothetical protein